VNPRAGLDDVGKRKFLTLPGLELRLLGRPACSKSLLKFSVSNKIKKYSLQYLYHCFCKINFNIIFPSTSRLKNGPSLIFFSPLNFCIVALCTQVTGFQCCDKLTALVLARK
jgi:hypothetical protein